MANDVFGSSDLFDEFERTNDRTDRILMSQIDDTTPGSITSTNTDRKQQDAVNGHQNTAVRLGFSDSSDSDSVSDFGDDADHEHQGLADRDDDTLNSRLQKTTSREADDKASLAQLQLEVQKLRQERDRLKSFSHKLKPVSCVDGAGPEMQVIFMNSGVSSKYKIAIERFLMGLMHDKAAIDNRNLETRSTTSSVTLDPDVSQIEDAKLQKQRKLATSAVGWCQLYSSFAVDYMGWPLAGNLPFASEGWEIPQYQQVYFVPLPLSEDSEEPKKEKRPKPACFNCGEGHTLKDCKVPLNQNRISENRRKFMGDVNKFQGQPSRYHAEDDPRFAKYKAGVISDDLRDALGLGRSDLPPYIYQMRLLGYPPGYLQALNEDNSQLAMFDKHGKEVKNDGDLTEDGELDSKPDGGIDVKKIISYPGFNVEIGSEYRDDHKRLGMPPMYSMQSKEMMIQQLTFAHGVKRSKSDASLGEGGSAKKKKRRDPGSQSDDMDLSVGESRSKLSRADTELLSQSSQDSDIGTLEELEEQKKLLEQQLALSEGGDADMEVVDSYSAEKDDSFIPPLPPTPVRPPLPTDTPPQTPPVGRTSRKNSLSASSTPVGAGPLNIFKTPDGQPCLLRTPSSGGSLSMSLGTPVSDRYDSDTKNKGLPKASSFADGVAEHIPFENLPGTTGRYEKMKDLIDQIRSQKQS